MLTQIDQAVIDDLTPTERDCALRSCERIIEASAKMDEILKAWNEPKSIETVNQLNQQ